MRLRRGLWTPRVCSRRTPDVPVRPSCDPNPGAGGIYARLEELGHSLGRFVEEVTARMPLPDEARALQLAVGVPVFRLVRTAYDSHGQALRSVTRFMASDRYVLTYELPAR